MISSEENNPLTKRYLRILRFFLHTIGAWPGEILGEDVAWVLRMSKYWWPFISVVAILAELYFVVLNYGKISPFLLGDVCITLSLSFLTLVRTILPNFKTYEKLFAGLIKKFHLIHYRHKNKIYDQTYMRLEKFSDTYTKFIMVLVVSTFSLFNVVPIYNSCKKGVFQKGRDKNISMEFSVYWELPGYNQQEKPFLLTTLFNTIMTYVCSVSVVAVDLMMTIMMIQMIGHIRILERNIMNLNYIDPTVLTEKSIVCKMYDQETNKSINNILKSCVDHHLLVIRFADDMSNFFGPMLACNYLFHLCACCLLLFECSKGDPNALARFGTLTAITFFQLVQSSVIYEFVSTTSENLSSAIYACPWECMNTSNRRVVSIMLQRMHSPIKVTAMGMTQVGVQTMASILKTTFSYFMFLNQKAR